MDEAPTEIGAAAPQQPQDDWLKPKPAVACLRCRDQKLKCDREQPSCARCRKQRAVCTYPLPPDRKKIAQNIKASQSRKIASLQTANTAGTVDKHRTELSPSTPEPSAKRQCVSRYPAEERLPNSGKNEETDHAELPSTEIGLLLLEVYFKRVYNATLLCHKNIAFQLYMQNDIPPFLLRAIFALAAIFLKEVDSPYKQHIKTHPIHTLSEKSWPWARSASKEVLSHADEPTLVKIQALQNLQLYYFSQGEIQRSAVHASLAYRLSQLLGYDKLHEDTASLTSNLSWQFDREMRRRCFWTSWCNLCIGHTKLDPSQACQEVVGLPLPAQFENGGSLKGVVLKLSQKMNVDWNLSVECFPTNGMAEESSCSLVAELVKVLGIWAKIQNFISNSAIDSNSQRVTTFSKLIELFEPVDKSLQLPIMDLCSRAELYDESPELLVSVCTIYYRSKLLLHASMIPILSGCSAALTSRESVLKNAEIVLRQAIEIAGVLQRLVTQDLDMTRLCPFSGHAAFVAGSVFLVYMTIMRSVGSPLLAMHVPGLDSEEMNTIQTVLGVLGIYWAPLRRLAVKLNKAIDAVGQSTVEGTPSRQQNSSPVPVSEFPYSSFEEILLMSNGDTVLNRRWPNIVTVMDLWEHPFSLV